MQILQELVWASGVAEAGVDVVDLVPVSVCLLTCTFRYYNQRGIKAATGGKAHRFIHPSPLLFHGFSDGPTRYCLT